MILCLTPNPQNTFDLVQIALDECHGFVAFSVSDAQFLNASMTLDPAELFYSFSFAFGAVVTFWSLGLAFRWASTAINIATTR